MKKKNRTTGGGSRSQSSKLMFIASLGGIIETQTPLAFWAALCTNELFLRWFHFFDYRFPADHPHHAVSSRPRPFGSVDVVSLG